MSDLWEQVCERIDAEDLPGLAELLAGLDAEQRSGLLPLLEERPVSAVAPEPVVLAPLEPDPGPELPATGSFSFFWSPQDGPPPSDLGQLRAYLGRQRDRQRERDREHEKRRLEHRAAHIARQRTEQRQSARALAILACTASAADVVKRLHAPWTVGPRLRVEPEIVPGLLTARGPQWCATLARGMTRRARSRFTPWAFTEALIRAVGLPAPETAEAAVQYVRLWRGNELAATLADDPWLDRMLPFVFDDNRVATAFVSGVTGRRWPSALVELTRSGRVERPTVIAGCLRRLRAGGRQGLLKPYLDVLRQVAPTAAELAGHRQELTGLLSAPISTLAEFAYTGLQAVDREHGLDRGMLAEITQSMLSRPEKKLVRAHLSWLRSLPDDVVTADDVVEGLLNGLHHPAPELAEATVDLLRRRLPALSAGARDRLTAEVAMLDGAVAEQLAELLGAERPAPVAMPTPVVPLPVEMPPPLDLGALAGEVATALRAGDVDPVRHELILDGLVRAVRADRDAAARALAPLAPRWGGAWHDLLGAVSGYAPGHRPAGLPLAVFVQRRAVELAGRLAADPPPALLATPATVAGHVDPVRVLDLLRHAERDGWQPGDADLTQALLRLPRDGDAEIRAAAARLASPAGRRLADWLADRAEPRVWIEEVDGLPRQPARRVAMLDPAGLPSELADPRPAAERARTVWTLPNLELWPMVTPSHRELAAAHLQPLIAGTLDRGNPGVVFLDGLAAADGPPGPAMALTMAYALANHRESVRLAAGDALVALAARPDWDSAGVGAEVGVLAASDRIVLKRVVQPLTEAVRAGAHAAVWQVATAALPALLAAGQRPGLADLITLAGTAARAGGHRADLPELAVLAAGAGRSALTKAARQLAELMTGGPR